MSADTSIPNFNQLHGNDPQDIYKLQEALKKVDGYGALLDQNPAFVQAIISAVVAKNKLDYPPFGPTDPQKQVFQTLKIEGLIQAIQKLYAVSSGYGKLGISQTTKAGVNTASTWTQNTARGISRVVSAPSKAASSTYKSAKSLLGFTKGGRRKKHRKTLKRK